MIIENAFAERGVRLRGNFYGLEPRWAGKALHERMELNCATPRLLYKWVASQEGRIWIVDHRKNYKHSSLVAAGAQVHSAGLLTLYKSEMIVANCGSGHYMADDTLMGAEKSGWLQAMSESIRAYGWTPGPLTSSDDLTELKKIGKGLIRV